MTLKKKWIRAVRLAFLLAPALESRAVRVVPMFWPMIRGMAVLNRTAPVVDKACKMPVKAVEL